MDEIQQMVREKAKIIRHARRILIVKPSSMGDIVHAFKAVTLLQQNHPKAVFDWLVNPAFAELLDYCPVAIARKIEFHRKELGKMTSFLPEFIKLWFNLRKYKYDLTLDFQGLLRSAFFARIARSRHLAGFAAPREEAAAKFYKRKVELPADCRQAVQRNLELAKFYCAEKTLNSPLELPKISHNVHMARHKLAHRNLNAANGLVAIFPGARWESKVFPAELYAKLINDLHEKYPQMRFLLLGTINESAAACAIARLTGEYVCNMTGATGIGCLVELLRMCKLVVSNDSGPLHLAAILNRPTIAFYGPTDPGYTGPDGENVKVFQADVPCKNCLKRTCDDAAEKCHVLNYEQILKTAVYMLEGNK